VRAAHAENGGGMKVLIVDDEPLARARLRRLLETLKDIEIVGEADRGSTALVLAESLKPDLLLLDLEMPGLDGIGVAEKKGLPPVIFVTGNPNHAVAAFELDAVDYVLKPVRPERLEAALEKARRRIETQKPSTDDRLVVHDGGATLLIDPLTVELFSATDKYVQLVVDGRELLVRDSLDTLEGRFAPLGFLRVHRSALVRKDAVVRVGDGEVELKSGAKVEVSRRRSAELKRALGLRE
jgi:DNA-binding LytR/AlgR family response regulator